MMGTSEKMSSMECRFCHGLVGTEYGEVRKLERHMVNSHDMYSGLKLIMNYKDIINNKDI